MNHSTETDICLDEKFQKRTKNLPFVKRIGCKILKDRVPRRLKRLVFLSSILAVIENIKNPEDETIEKLNNLLKLANYDKAVIFPMYISSYIWTIENNITVGSKTFDLSNIDYSNLSDDDTEKLAGFFYTKSPTWLLYGSLELIKRDLKILFNNVPNLIEKSS